MNYGQNPFFGNNPVGSPGSSSMQAARNYQKASSKKKKKAASHKSKAGVVTQWSPTAKSSWGKMGFFSKHYGKKIRDLNLSWMKNIESMPLAWVKEEKRRLLLDQDTFPVKSGIFFTASSESHPLNPQHALRILNKKLSEREQVEELATADAQAKAQGFESAADLLATKDVEREWYSKKYGADSSAKIEAFKALERDKFGKTSFESAMAGEHDPQLVGQGVGEDSVQSIERKKEEMAAQLEADQLALVEQQKLNQQQQIIAQQAESEKRKNQNMLIAGGAIALLVVGYLALRK